MKKIIQVPLLSFAVLISSCTINVDTEDECLECSYQYQELLRTERVCDDLGSDDDMEAMRDRMQMEADSLGVKLKCIRE